MADVPDAAGAMTTGDAAGADTIRCPLCIYQQHCGSRAVLGPPRDLDGCINRTIRCLSCGAKGEQSINTEREEVCDDP